MLPERIEKELKRLQQLGYAVRITAVSFHMTGDEGLSGMVVYMSEERLLENDKRIAERQRKKLTVVKT